MSKLKADARQFISFLGFQFIKLGITMLTDVDYANWATDFSRKVMRKKLDKFKR